MGQDNGLSYACDWRFAINLSASRKGTCGYLLAFTGLGGLSLKQDIEVWNPFDGAGQTVVTGATIKCIGLIDSLSYEGGESDPIRIRCYVSKGTSAEIRAKLYRPLPSTKLKLAFYVVAFDEDSKKWYEAAFAKQPQQAEASIDSANGQLQMFVDSAPTKASETLDLNVFGFEFQVVPAEGKSTNLEFATGPAQRMIKCWGEAG